MRGNVDITIEVNMCMKGNTNEEPMKRMRIESEKISQFLVECNLLQEHFLICHNVFE